MDKESPVELIVDPSIDTLTEAFDAIVDPTLTYVYFLVQRKITGGYDPQLAIVKTDLNLEVIAWNSFNKDPVQFAWDLDKDGNNIFVPLHGMGVILEFGATSLAYQRTYSVPNVVINSAMKLVILNDVIFVSCLVGSTYLARV